MSNSFDTLASNLVSNLIPKFAKKITLKTITKGTYNPLTGEVTADTETSSSVYATISNYGGKIVDDNKLIDNDRILLNDLRVKIYTSNIDENSLLIIDNKTYKIISYKVVYAVESIYAIEAQVRQING